MTPQEFLVSLETVLQSRRVPLSRAAAIVFVESCWELIDDEPDVWEWSERFIEAGAVRPGRGHAGRLGAATRVGLKRNAAGRIATDPTGRFHMNPWHYRRTACCHPTNALPFGFRTTAIVLT